jgi:uncharacterized protein (UPF0179 family)
MNWESCFKMEEGKTYRVRFVRRGVGRGDVVEEGEFQFNGEVWSDNTAVLIPTDRTWVGPINILEIEEQAARGEVR